VSTMIEFEDVRDEYRRLFRNARVRTKHKRAVDDIVASLVSHRRRYERVGDPLGIPWWFVAIIHNLEASQNFHTHLHNGDPLTAKTVHVPAGRPPGRPPFKWVESARDALTLHGLAHQEKWTSSRALYRWERFNGFGYRLPSVNIHSPYLWSFSQHYKRGKFSSDGHFDPNLVSAQAGAAVLLRAMVDDGIVVIGASQPEMAPS
jgi:lysozyme family protein